MTVIEPVLNLVGLGIVVILVGGLVAWVPAAVIRWARAAIE